MTENGFKETDIGLIPQDWAVDTLGRIFNIQQGKSLSPKSRQGVCPRPFLRTANVLWGRIDLSELDQMDFNELEITKLALEKNDLLVCEGGDIGRTAIWEKQIPLCLYQNHLHRLRVNRTDIVPRFFMYWMQAALTLLGLYEGAGNRTTIPNLSRSRLSSFLVPVPSKEEQEAVVLVMHKLQQTISQQEQIIAKTRELKRSLMHRLFTHGLRGEELKKTEIGLMPSTWQLKTVGEIATLKRGYDLPRDKFEKGNIPVMGSNGCIGHHDKAMMQGPGVITGRSGSIGKLAYVDSAYWPHNTALYVKDFHDNFPLFIYYLLHRLDFNKYKTGVSVPTLNRNFIHMAILAVPPIEEQKEIADILFNIDKRISQAESRKEVLQLLFKSMLQLLMTGQVRVKDLDFSPSG